MMANGTTATFGKCEQCAGSKWEMSIKPMLHLLRLIGPLFTHIFGSNLFLANLDCGAGPIEIMGDAAGLITQSTAAQRSLLHSIATVYRCGPPAFHSSQMRFSQISNF